MRGIAGVYGKQDKEAVMKMSAKLDHRGPRTKYLSGDNYVLAQIGGAKTWKSSETGDLAVVTDVLEKDDQKATLSHIVAGLESEEWQPLLNNTAPPFVLAAVTPAGLVLARDKVGLSFISYLETEDAVYFATEMKALFALDFTSARIKQLPPGYIYESGHSEPVSFAQISSNKEVEEDAAGISRKLNDLLRSSVRNVLAPDRRPGLLLSGGLDSSIIAAIAVAESPQSLPSFSVGIEGSPDLKYARLVADHLGTDHYEYTYDEEEMLSILPRVIYYQETFDAPLIRSSIPNYLLAEYVAGHGCKRVLSGEGADELFAGYSYLRDESKNKINSELQELTRSLGEVGLMRVDRMNAAHGLDCQLPFLNLDFIEYALAIPSQFKLRKDESHGGDEPIEKWILRQAFTDLLPEEVIWRDKAMFGEGSGSIDICQLLNEQRQLNVAGEMIELPESFGGEGYFSAEVRDNLQDEEGVLLRSQEEYYYYKIFKSFYPELERLPDLSRWENSYK